jgi:hypothetical protein
MTSTARVLFRRPRAQAKTKGTKRPLFSLTPTDEAILIALGRYTYLRIDQLAKLLPPIRQQRRSRAGQSHSPRYLQQRTKLLEDHGYLRRRYLFPAGPSVKAPAMFWLNAPGLAVVRALEHPIFPPPKTSEVEAASPSHLRHTLLANDLLILSELLCREHPERIWLERSMTERELARQGVPVRLSDGTTSLVKPDGFVDLRIDRGEEDEQMCACFELDNGSEYKVAWWQKLQRLLAFAAGPYQAWAGTTALVIPVVAATGPSRAARLLAMTEEFLLTRQAADVASLFRFCSLDPTQATADQLFSQPIWFVPFHDAPVPLIAAASDEITVTPLSPGALQVASGFPSQYLTSEEMARFLSAVESSASAD